MSDSEATQTARALEQSLVMAMGCRCSSAPDNYRCIAHRLWDQICAALTAARQEAQEEIERLRAEMGYHEAKDVIEMLAAERDDHAARVQELAARVRELEARREY